MLRQSPVKKKRGELNIERHFLRADFKQVAESRVVTAETSPQQSVAVIELPDKVDSVDANYVSAEVVTPAVTATPSTSTPPVSSAPTIATQNVTPQKRQVPQSLPRSTSSSLKIPEVEHGNRSAAQNNVTKIPNPQPNIDNNGIVTAMPDSDWRIGQYHLPEILTYLVESEVDGGGVFALLNDGLRKAREFDDKLFVSIFETAIHTSCKGENNGLAKETLAQLQQIDGFDECYQKAISINENCLQLSSRKFLRESRLAVELPLLMFPSVGFGSLSWRAGCDYFVAFGGNGTAINPSCDFWECLFRVGGVAGDVNNVVITGREKIDFVFIKQLRFYRGQQADLPLLKFFVPNELASELTDIPNTVTTEIESIAADGNEIKLSDGVKMLLQSDQLSLGLLTGGGISWIRFVGQSGFLREYSSGDVLVFPVDDLEGLFSAIGLAKIADAAITIFDISRQAGALTQLLQPVRKYLGAVAVAAPTLVCNVGAGQFLDVVKGFESDKDVWSSYSEIDNQDDMLYYFAKNARERFVTERYDITETFMANLRRRHGLYFKK